MTSIDGSYDCTVKSPLGDQHTTLTLRSDGDRFTGTASGVMGSMDIQGSVDGNVVTWKQQVTVPMPLTLDFTATIDDDTLSGSVGAGAFGSYPVTGTRTA